MHAKIRHQTKQYSGLLWACLVLLLCFLANPTIASDGQSLDDELGDKLKQAIEDSDSFQDRFDAEVWLLDMSLRPY